MFNRKKCDINKFSLVHLEKKVLYPKCHLCAIFLKLIPWYFLYNYIYQTVFLNGLSWMCNNSPKIYKYFGKQQERSEKNLKQYWPKFSLIKFNSCSKYVRVMNSLTVYRLTWMNYRFFFWVKFSKINRNCQK